MLRVLNATPGVTDTKIINDQDKFCLQYRANEKARWVEPTEFCLTSPRDAVDGPYDFWATLPGVHAVGEELDVHISRAVMDKWNALCGVRASAITV
jgi:hypothetical protein